MNTQEIVKNFVSSTLWILACVNLQAQTDLKGDVQLHDQRGQEALRANKPDVAAREFREILRLDPDNPQAYANLGVVVFAQAKYAEAAEAFRQALRHQPSLWNARALLGMSEVRLGNVAKGQDLLEESFPHLQDGRLIGLVGMDLIRIYYEANDLDRSISTLRVLQQAAPRNEDVLYTAYRTHSALAARSLQSLANVAPESGRMHQILAQSLASQDNFLGAIDQYRRALQINPRLPGVHFELGQTILANSHEEAALKEAQKEFEAELAVNPTDSSSEYGLGEIYWLRSDLGLALKHFSRAVQLRPIFVDAQIGVGKVLTAMAKPQEALAYLMEATRADPQNEVAHYRLALAYRKLGRIQDANREMAAFKRLRESHNPIRALLQEILQQPSTPQTVEGGERPSLP
jgi:tetratricopeptide (TPR) repeat protein